MPNVLTCFLLLKGRQLNCRVTLLRGSYLQLIHLYEIAPVGSLLLEVILRTLVRERMICRALLISRRLVVDEFAQDRHIHRSVGKRFAVGDSEWQRRCRTGNLIGRSSIILRNLRETFKANSARLLGTIRSLRNHGEPVS